jgi:tetratricopeptide (TPR) repeat protein
MRGGACRVAALCWVLGSAPALAQPKQALERPRSASEQSPVDEASVPSSKPQRLAEARSHFRLGLQLFEARNFREALREFELVAQLAPSAELWFNIGRAHEELGEYERAARALERYLHDRVDASDAAAVRERIRGLDALAARERERSRAAPDTGSLRIHSRSPGALLLLDGQPLRAETLDEPLLLPSGQHQLDALQADHLPLHAQIAIEPGLLTAAYVDLAPATRARTEEPSHAFTWSLLGLGAGGAIASAVFAGVALSEQSAGDVRRAEAWAERTDVALAGTAVCALAAVLLYFIEERSAHSTLQRMRPSQPDSALAATVSGAAARAR